VNTMQTDKQKKVKIYLKDLQSQMTELYEEMIVKNASRWNNSNLVDKFEELAEEFHKNDFDMRQLGLRGCIHNDVCPEYVVCCCNWCSGLGVWNPELRKEYERSKNES